MGCGTSAARTTKSVSTEQSAGVLRGRQSDEAVGPPQNSAGRSNPLPVENHELIKLSSPTPITIVHFNDVYCVDARGSEPIGGAARFVTGVKQLSNKRPLVLFSGDCFSPSAMSNVTKGRHMVPVLNEVDVKAAVIGNHDFDFGVDNLCELIESTTAVWLLSNVTDRTTGKPLAGQKHTIIEWEGHKVGLMGLIEQEWLVTLATISTDDVTFTGFVEQAKQTAEQLRKEGADIVIALTHMRMPNDVLLAEGTQGVIDLVLGGHDHSYETKQVGDVFVCKSGTDFREFTEITVNFDNGKLNVDTCKHKITSDIPEDEVVKAALKKFQDKIESQMEEVLDVIDFQFEGRFSELRTGETNLGNLIVDVMRQVTHADVAIINSGTMRSDTMHGPGQIKMKDLSTILPMLDTITVLQVTGSQLMAALENGVSQYPKHEGRFPQVSGLKFCFDPDCEAYHRIVKDSVVVGNEPLQENKTYKLCTKGYLAAGKDGYEILQQAGVLLSEHDGPLLPIIIQNHFNSVAVQRGVKKSSSKHIQNPSLHSLNNDTPSYFYPKVEGRIKILHKERDEEASIKRDLKIGDESHPIGQEKDGNVEGKRERSDIKSDEHVAATSSNQPNETDAKDGSQHTSQQKLPIQGISVQQMNSKPHSMPPLQKRPTEQLKAVEITKISSEDEMYALWEAVKANDIEQVKSLISSGVNPSQLVDTRTVLHLVAEKDLVDVAKYLLGIAKMKPDIRDEVLQSTPLHIAADGGSEEVDLGSPAVALLLLDKGADINATDLLGNTPLHVACSTGQEEVKKILLERNADRTIKNLDGETPIV